MAPVKWWSSAESVFEFRSLDSLKSSADATRFVLIFLALVQFQSHSWKARWFMVKLVRHYISSVVVLLAAAASLYFICSLLGNILYYIFQSAQKKWIYILWNSEHDFKSLVLRLSWCCSTFVSLLFLSQTDLVFN